MYGAASLIPTSKMAGRRQWRIMPSIPSIITPIIFSTKLTIVDDSEAGTRIKRANGSR
jgi:hypothetical protein